MVLVNVKETVSNLYLATVIREIYNIREIKPEPLTMTREEFNKFDELTAVFYWRLRVLNIEHPDTYTEIETYIRNKMKNVSKDKTEILYDIVMDISIGDPVENIKRLKSEIS